jgi:hypothetical protein
VLLLVAKAWLSQVPRALLPAMIDSTKIPWSGVITSVQPRIRLLRSFDERSHSYLGYVLRIHGDIGGEQREFAVAVGTVAHAKHQFTVGNHVSGVGVPVADPRLETADLYKVSGVKVGARAAAVDTPPPPWHGLAPPIETYRKRGHRRLAAGTYERRCTTCIWGCRMPVEMIIDQWKPDIVRHRTETFCYGPLSCPWYKAGPTRKVPGRRGMVWEEPAWLDEEETKHRSPDE